MSLIEVIVGMSILSVVMMAGIAALPEIRELTYRSDQRQEASAILDAHFESLRTLTYEQLKNKIDTASSYQSIKNHWDNTLLENTVLNQVDVTMNGNKYAIAEYTSYMPVTGTDEKIIQAYVTVSWNHKDKTNTLSGLTLFSENGLSDKKFRVAN